MITAGKIVLAAFASVLAFGPWKFFWFMYNRLTSPIRHLRGPKGTSWIYGNLQDVWNAENFILAEEWVKQYGGTLTYKGFFCSNRLFTMDVRAINHVLTHTTIYQKPSHIQYHFTQFLGKGVLTTEGAQHRKQRRVLNPAFGPAQIRELTDIFLGKAIQLRDVWSSQIAKDPAGASTGARFDVMIWLSRVTLDVIGLAGFNYNFDSLNVNERPSELEEAFMAVVAAAQRQSIFPVLQAWFPPLRFLPSNPVHKIQLAQQTMSRIAKALLSSAKLAAGVCATEKGQITKHCLHDRDLLSLLVKANMATDIPESQRLSDEDVMAQIPTFLAAGHGTTSAATTWALYAMTNAREIQTRLRKELLSVSTETPSMDELTALPYLDAIVKETLRMHAPIPSSLRVAMQDDVLPVEKPYMDKYGVVHDSIRINKGDPILTPIQVINRSQELWGPDAHEFRPERWYSIPKAVSHIPSVWAHLLTFLGGPRACIGYRFSIVEMKALLFTLVRAFEFELAVPATEIGKNMTVVQQPVLRSDPKRTPRLPLLVKPYERT